MIQTYGLKILLKSPFNKFQTQTIQFFINQINNLPHQNYPQRPNYLKKQLLQLSLQQLVQLYQKDKKNLNSANLCLIIKEINRKNNKSFNKLEIKTIIIESLKQIKLDLPNLNSTNFSNYMALISEIQDQTVVNKQFKSIFFQQIIKRFSKLNIIDFTVCLRSLRKMCPMKQWPNEYVVFLNELNIESYKIPADTQIKDLIYFYDSIILFSKQQTKKQAQNKIDLNELIKNKVNISKNQILQKISKQVADIIIDNLELMNYELKSLPIFLKSYAKNNQLTNISQKVQKLLQKIVLNLQQYHLQDLSEVINLLQIMKYSNVKLGNETILVIMNNLISRKVKIMKIKLQEQQKQQQIVQQDIPQTTESDKYIIGQINDAQINKIINWFTHFGYWNSQVFELVQESFFQLFEKNIPTIINISIYCIERCKMGQHLISLINKNEQKISTIGKRVQIIKKSHMYFMDRVVSHLIKHSNIYQTNQILLIITSCQSFPLASRKIKKKIRTLLQIKGISDTKEGNIILQKIS